MRVVVTLPTIGMTMEEATVVRYCVRPGEPFRAGDPLYEIETEKVSNDIEATVDGVMLEHSVAEGDIVSVGGQVCVIETPG
jgi:pyruvate/2-oxoglutarate dehydrogenase complex dihydrolipoamide acyltransferase (E2) component